MKSSSSSSSSSYSEVQRTASVGPTQFDHERLDVYALELEFIAWVTELLKDVRDTPGNSSTEIRSQLDRASISITLNTAEGNGKRQMPLRARFFDDARGSAVECAACLDVLVAKKFCAAERVGKGKAVLLRIVSMLSKLVDRFSGQQFVRENEVNYLAAGVSRTRTKDDDEDERVN